VPFASHPVNTLRWWDDFHDDLANLGAYTRAEGMRLTMHPGHHTVLSSPRRNVVDATIADLLYHARFLDSLGMGTNGKLVVHVGGTYGDRLAALDRFAATYLGLPAALKARLVLENDERSYSVADVLAISRQTGIPVVFDALHDLILPSPNVPERPVLLKACFATWQPVDGRPIVHYSIQDPAKQPGAHAEWIDPDAFLRFDRDTGSTDVDCMLEAKGKELALVRLRDEVAARRARAA
jgi:UV DNA damage endonuclease